MTKIHRTDIDGLRAIAVIPVVAYHTGFLTFSGGFVGVDVFYAISGYLIASLLIEDIVSNRYDITNFYERRIRRLLPAFLTMALVTASVAALVLLPQDLKSFGRSLWSSAVFSSNLSFWVESGDYFDASGYVKPLLHTWSLAVEEQYYLFFPLILALTFRLSGLQFAFRFCVLVFAVSLGLSAYAQQHTPLANFYLLPTRAWEILAGTLLAFGYMPMPRIRLGSELLGLFGLLCILVPVFSYNSTTSFPGLAAVPPVLGAVLILHGGNAGHKTLSRRFLSLAPMRFVGLISYSLYLWHWPVIVFFRYIFQQLSVSVMCLIVAVSFALAIISWRFVETPFRGRDRILRRPYLFFASTAGILVAVAFGLLFQLSGGLPNRFPVEIVKMADKGTYHGPWRECGGAYAKRRTERTLCILGSHNVDVPPTFLVVGDSHAEAVAAAIFEAAAKMGRSGYQITDSGYRPLIGFRKFGEVPKYEYLNRLVEAVLDQHPDVSEVILPIYWRQSVLVDTYYDDREERVSGRFATEQGLEALLARYPFKRFLVIVSGANSPRFGGAAAARAVWFGRDFMSSVSRAEFEGMEDQYADVLQEIGRNTNVSLLRLADRLCDSARCYGTLSDGNLAYSDDNHLSYAASKLFEPDFARFLQSVP